MVFEENVCLSNSLLRNAVYSSVLINVLCECDELTQVQCRLSNSDAAEVERATFLMEAIAVVILKNVFRLLQKCQK